MKENEREISCGIYESPIGPLAVVCTRAGVKSVGFGGGQEKTGEESKEMLAWAIRELKEYFEGERKVFTVPCVMEGTDFQKRVWNALTEIPYGEIRSYKEIAVRTGNPKACRAVGMANHRNPIPIIVPCHRVVGTNGKLTGYAGGLEIKEKLLKLERDVHGGGGL